MLKYDIICYAARCIVVDPLLKIGINHAVHEAFVHNANCQHIRATVRATTTVSQIIGTLSNRRRRPDDGNRKRDISFETSLRMYNTL